MTLTASSPESLGNYHRPSIEMFDDGNGTSVRFTHMEMQEPGVFGRDTNQSGFRRAVDFVAEQTGMPMPKTPEGERKGPEPVLVIVPMDPVRAGIVELYDGRRPTGPTGRRHWYGMRQDRPSGKFEVKASTVLDGDTQVEWGEGDLVYLGMISGKLGKQSTPAYPSQEFFRNLTQATARHRGEGGVRRIVKSLFSL